MLILLKEIDKQDKIIAEIRAIDPKAPVPQISIDTDKLAPYPKYTDNIDENARALSEWIKKKAALKETFEKIKEIRKANELTAI